MERVEVRLWGWTGGEERVRVGSEYFAEGESWGLLGAEVEVRVRLKGEWRDRRLLGVELSGWVELECDRCLGRARYGLGYEGDLELRLADRGDVLEDGEVWEVPRGAERVDIGGYVRESVYLSLPMRCYHGMEGVAAGECDSEMRGYIRGSEEDGPYGGARGGTLGKGAGAALGALLSAGEASQG